MNVNGYGLNVQYQKTQLSYEMELSKVNPNNNTQSTLLEENSELSESNLHIVYMSEENLNNSEMLHKMILEATYSQYSNSSNQLLFPNIKTTNSEDIPKEIQAYGNQKELPDGLIYTASSEYYEKTTFDFTGEIRVKTPQGEYNIALNLSYTQEFYEKNESFIKIANEKLQSPLEIELAEDNESLKGLNSISLLFENIPEEKSNDGKKDFFEKLMESLKERKEFVESLLVNSQEEQMDNYQVYMSKNEEEYQLVSAQKDGFGIFFSDTKSESSYLEMGSNENGSYISAGYSISQTTSLSTFEAKA